MGNYDTYCLTSSRLELELSVCKTDVLAITIQSPIRQNTTQGKDGSCYVVEMIEFGVLFVISFLSYNSSPTMQRQSSDR